MQKSGLHEYIDHMVRWNGRTFLVGYHGYRQKRWSFAEIRGYILELSSSFARLHVRKGDRIILFGKSSPEWVVAFFAVLHRGAIVVPLDPGTRPDFFSRVVEKTSPALIISDAQVNAAGVPTLELDSICSGRRVIHDGAADADDGEPDDIRPDDVAEIVFTSGTTSRPKGVVLTHRNILSDLEPIDAGVQKRRRIVRLVTPVRLLCTVPYSHMFGQATGIFLPILIGSTVYFARESGPAALVREIRRNRILTLIAVPRILKLLMDHVKSELSTRGKLQGFERRWDRWVHLTYPLRVFFFLDVHLMLGIRFWSFIVGGAALDAETHEFWRRLVYAVFQGYGLTETAPMVTMFNPFRHSSSSVGELFPGQEIRIGEDGEILVRGENVMAGYWDDPESSKSVLENGWLRTGDIGEIDERGQLYIRGRKKDLIVTEDGHNVYPEDVKQVLDTIEGVNGAAVIGDPEEGGERVHAVLILERGTDPGRVVQQANSRLLPYQRIKSFTLWDEADFPRTATQKVRKGELLSRIRSGETKAGAGTAEPVGFLEDAGVDESRAVRDIGVSSLDLVEAIGEIEKKYNISIDETLLGEDVTVGQIRELVNHPQAARSLPMPRWARWRITGLFRGAVRILFLFPFFRMYCRVKARGLARLGSPENPAILAANHTSDLDPVALLLALPFRMRRRIAPAMGLNRFYPFFSKYGRVSSDDREIESHGRRSGPFAGTLYRLGYLIITFLFQTFPFPQTTAFRGSFEYIGELLDSGRWILLFPEGTVSPDGEIRPFRGGVAVIAEKTGVPVYPVAIRGMHHVLPPGRRWPRRSRVLVFIGDPLRFGEEESVESFTRKVEAAVREMLSSVEE